MKTTGLLFLAMTWTAWAPGTGYAVPAQETSHASSANPASGHPDDAGHAAPPRDGKHPTEGTASHEQRDHGRASGPNHPPNRASLTKANRPPRPPNGRPRALPGNAMNPHPPGSDPPRSVGIGGFIPNRAVPNAMPVRTSSLVRPTPLSLNNVHHRSPNPAVVGGSPNLRSGNIGAINGTRMNRKP
jgi:hypothetical protein